MANTYMQAVIAFDILQTPTSTLSLLFSNQYNLTNQGTFAYASHLGTYEYFLGLTFYTGSNNLAIFG